MGFTLWSSHVAGKSRGFNGVMVRPQVANHPVPFFFLPPKLRVFVRAEVGNSSTMVRTSIEFIPTLPASDTFSMTIPP